MYLLRESNLQSTGPVSTDLWAHVEATEKDASWAQGGLGRRLKMDKSPEGAAAGVLGGGGSCPKPQVFTACEAYVREYSLPGTLRMRRF